jgi:carbon-monoxide dehydrogenase small subunit
MGAAGKKVDAMDSVKITVTVNGRRHEREVEPRRLLSDFIREDLRLTGTHLGCEHGVCGSCTILMNDQTTRSCLTFAVMADGAEITTIEGLGSIENMHPLQAAFWEKHGLQCGFCTPGMLMTALELLRENPSANREEIREALSGNLCRCTGYQTIVESIEAAAETMRGADT